MWQDPVFRQSFSEEFQAKGVPERAMLFTTDSLLEQMAIVTRCFFLLFLYQYCKPLLSFFVRIPFFTSITLDTFFSHKVLYFNFTRWSVDGTHRVTPKHFSQLFKAMMKVSEKWIPGVYGLLPSHDKDSYRCYLSCTWYCNECEIVSHALTRVPHHM